MSRKTHDGLKSINTTKVSVVCVPPEGEDCWMSRPPRKGFEATDAAQHAVHNPGHVVIYERHTEIRYLQPRSIRV